MTIINFEQNIVDPFNYYDYNYSFDFTNNVQVEDEINDIEEVDIVNDMITVTFRSLDWYDYVSNTYIDNEWYVITPISTYLFDMLFDNLGYTQSDIYYFTAPIGLTFIAYNQLAENTLVYNGNWNNDFISLNSIKLLLSTVQK